MATAEEIKKQADEQAVKAKKAAKELPALVKPTMHLIEPARMVIAKHLAELNNGESISTTAQIGLFKELVFRKVIDQKTCDAWIAEAKIHRKGAGGEATKALKETNVELTQKLAELQKQLEELKASKK